jgi:hypothetical protein
MTDMRIEEIRISGELPKSCLQCLLPRVRHFWGGGMDGKCIATDRDITPEINNGVRPTWCPLVKQKDGEE